MWVCNSITPPPHARLRRLGSYSAAETHGISSLPEGALSFAIYKAKAASAAMAAMADPAWSWPAAPVKTGAAGAVASGDSSGVSGATDGWTDGWTEASAPSSGLVGDGESSPLPLAMTSQILVVVWRVSVMDVRSCSTRQANGGDNLLIGSSPLQPERTHGVAEVVMVLMSAHWHS